MSWSEAWSSYKRDKEEWIMGQSGSSIAYINLLSLTPLASYALWLCVNGRRKHNLLHSYVADFVMLVAPLMLACTTSSHDIVTLLSCLTLPTVVLMLHEYRTRTKIGTQRVQASEDGRLPLKHANNRVTHTQLDADESNDASFGERFCVHADGSSTQEKKDLDSDTSIKREALLSRNGSQSRLSSLHQANLQGKHLSCMPLSPPCFETCSQNSMSTPIPNDLAQSDKFPRQKWSYVTIYRAYLMMLTTFCILAVDFPVFPRFLAKCETWGTSLMDLGVGSFAFSHGLVSLRSKRSSFSRLLRRTLPLLLLGAVRVLMVKRTKYPEHVSEYGVHWNFFFTMGLVLPFIDVSQQIWRPGFAPFGLYALGIALVHESVLAWTPLGLFAISDARNPLSWVSLNKEGLVSLPGYVVIALAGLDIAHIMADTRRRDKLERDLCIRSFCLWLGVWIIRCLDFQISRRLVCITHLPCRLSIANSLGQLSLRFMVCCI